MLSAEALVAAAVEQTGLEDFGGETWREGLAMLTESLAAEGELTEMGEQMLEYRLRTLLVNRLRIEDVYRLHPEIDNETIEGPVFIIGLPRTGTTALSQLLAVDPEIRSLRLWESGDPVPPPEAATRDSDPRIEETRRGLDAMYATFPKMLSLYFQTADGPTECQDLLGMEFRTGQFDGMAHVPSYTTWALDCDMLPAYVYHRRTLKLLQWHCPPRFWHLKTPVHMFALDTIIDMYPDARFLWTHRDPAEVLGSVCSLISYTRSWVSDRDDSAEIVGQQARLWAEALRRAISVRDRIGDARFADIHFDALNADPVAAVDRAYANVGMSMSPQARTQMASWAAENPRGGHGSHDYSLAGVGNQFAFYNDRFDINTG